MSEAVIRVSDIAALYSAADMPGTTIEIQSSMTGLSSFNLAEGAAIRGAEPTVELSFKSGQPGVMLTANNTISGLRVVTDDAQIAIGLADSVEELGTLAIRDVTTVGRFHLEAAHAKRGALELTNIHVESADARMAAHRPAGFGVEVLLGGVTIYNASKDPRSRWYLVANRISGGSPDKPLRGSGVFVFGGSFVPVDADPGNGPAPTQAGGNIELMALTTGEIHSDGGIPPGTGNLITGGVFVGSGVHARSVVNLGTTNTYGVNDMVLDNWGKVDSWIVEGPVTSAGSSGIGFVNFGDIERLSVKAPIVTRGLGARGFNLYDGSLQRAEFDSIRTFGDGAIGVQISRPFGTIVVNKDVRTTGGEGESLVRGKVLHLKAHAISLKPGTTGEQLIVHGAAEAEAEGVESWDFQAPASVISRIEVGGNLMDR